MCIFKRLETPFSNVVILLWGDEWPCLATPRWEGQCVSGIYWEKTSTIHTLQHADQSPPRKQPCQLSWAEGPKSEDTLGAAYSGCHQGRERWVMLILNMAGFRVS